MGIPALGYSYFIDTDVSEFILVHLIELYRFEITALIVLSFTKACKIGSKLNHKVYFYFNLLISNRLGLLVMLKTPKNSSFGT
ncbi:unnamed protein product [Blumeria hordei]|uniref:Uncharacterized protein n=1 Tax=Blumeria hordei TaxID=2867405 RepID=A0A383V289_BLUHO|nr:unnamed protein product [Blumeria hordei]